MPTWVTPLSSSHARRLVTGSHQPSSSESCVQIGITGRGVALSIARRAVAYAERRGVVFIASAADENSFHHNFPSTYEGGITVKAIVPDSYVSPIEDRVAPFTRTFLQHSGCANFGPGMHLAVPSTSCSSKGSA